MLDARQAELGRQLAERPPPWALEAWGVPPAEPGALRQDWERRAGIVESYRESAGITDPAQAIGPVPSGQAQLREAFHSAVVALELPDDQALLRAQGRGELEATVAAHDRAAALAPPDVQATIGEREAAWEDAQVRGHNAGYAMDAEAQAAARADAADAARDLARLAVADAARREWAEAHAGQAAAAREADAELQRRDQAERVASAGGAGNATPREQSIPQAERRPEPEQTLVEWWREIHDPERAAEVPEVPEPVAEVDETEVPEAEPGGQTLVEWLHEIQDPERQPPAEPEPAPEMSDADAAWWADVEREVAAAAEPKVNLAEWWRGVQDPEQAAAPEPEAEAAGQPETNVSRSLPEPEPETGADADPGAGDRAAMHAEIHEDLQRIGRQIDELADRGAEADARRAEAQQEILDEPASWRQAQAQAEAALEPSWRPGEAVADAGEATADIDMEAEM